MLELRRRWFAELARDGAVHTFQGWLVSGLQVEFTSGPYAGLAGAVMSTKPATPEDGTSPEQKQGGDWVMVGGGQPDAGLGGGVGDVSSLPQSSGSASVLLPHLGVIRAVPLSSLKPVAPQPGQFVRVVAGPRKGMVYRCGLPVDGSILSLRHLVAGFSVQVCACVCAPCFCPGRALGGSRKSHKRASVRISRPKPSHVA